MVDQLDAELGMASRLEGLAQQQAPAPGGTATGVLPIHIQVPTSGQVYRFAKTIIKPEDLLTFNVVYTQSWVGRAAKWIIFLVIVLVLFLNRRGLKRRWHVLTNCYGKHRVGVEKCAQSTLTPFVLFGLLIVSMFVSRFFTLLFFFLFWVSAVYHFTLHRRRRRMKKEIISAQSKEIPHLETDEQGAPD